MAMFQVLAVSQLNFFVKSLLEGQPQLKEVYVRGEISNYARNSISGHCYFSLKDETSSVRCVMFRRNADDLIFSPQTGMRVIVRASATLYERDGGFQLVCYDMQPDGLGAVYLAVQQLRTKLEAEGLFDQSRKKLIPTYPQTVGVVTSAQAAAYTDIISVLARRWPLARVLLSPTPVQGRGAAHEMSNALLALDKTGECDVIIVGRGGGSTEDLWEFNSEELARAVAECKTPVISAVGHERDSTLCDLCADLRAPTPSAAAELAVPDIQNEKDYLYNLAFDLKRGINIHLAMHNREILQKKSQVYALNPQKMVKENRQTYEHLVKLFIIAMERQLERRTTALEHQRKELSARNPLEILTRGYSVTADENGVPFASIDSVREGRQIITRLSDGEILSTVTQCRKLRGE